MRADDTGMAVGLSLQNTIDIVIKYLVVLPRWDDFHVVLTGRKMETTWKSSQVWVMVLPLPRPEGEGELKFRLNRCGLAAERGRTEPD